MHLGGKRARYDDRAILIAERPREIGEAENVGERATVETCEGREQEPQASQPTHGDARETKEDAWAIAHDGYLSQRKSWVSREEEAGDRARWAGSRGETRTAPKRGPREAIDDVSARSPSRCCDDGRPAALAPGLPPAPHSQQPPHHTRNGRRRKDVRRPPFSVHRACTHPHPQIQTAQHPRPPRPTHQPRARKPRHHRQGRSQARPRRHRQGRVPRASRPRRQARGGQEAQGRRPKYRGSRRGGTQCEHGGRAVQGASGA